MPKREPVPGISARPRDVMFSGTEAPVSAPLPPSYVKTSAYIRPEQVTMLDERRAGHRQAGRRTVSASDLIRTALDLAAQHADEWDELVARAAAR